MYSIKNTKSCASTDFDFKSITHSSEWLSYVGRRADALALRAEERRDKLRKAAGSGIYTVIRRYLNGATQPGRPWLTLTESIG